jgi:predicted metal-dependent hydrolase
MQQRGRTTGRTAGVSPLQLPLWSARDESCGWSVRISRRARRLSMRVFPGGRVEVVVPPGIGVPAVERFVARHRDWAERRARELALHAPPAGERRPDRVELSMIGRHWSIEYLAARRSRVLDLGDGTLRVAIARDDDTEIGATLLRWLTDVAEFHLTARLESQARQLGIDYTRLQLRRQRTRWGSCSSAGAISLNVCLMFHREPDVRYLLTHELDWRALDAELLKGWRNVPAWVFP